MYVVSIDTTYYLVVITTKYIFWFINQNMYLVYRLDTTMWSTTT